MQEKDADLWWDVILDIVQKDIGKVVGSMRGLKGCINTKFLRWKKLFHHLSMNL
jgi:hypothetical protein